MSGLDFIGDIHGDSERLRALLARLGYVHGHHPDRRKAVFLGDVIDGQNDAETIDIIRECQDMGGAVVLMANHEFNAICMGTRTRVGKYLKEHTPRRLAAHAGFLKDFPLGSEAHEDALSWLKRLPVVFSQKGVLGVHACWNRHAMGVVAPYLNADHTLGPDFFAAYAQNEKLRINFNILVAGPHVTVPADQSFVDKNGDTRNRARVYWWEQSRSPENALEGGRMWYSDLTPAQKNHFRKIAQDFNEASQTKNSMVFFGHYELFDKPRILSPRAVCLNFVDRLVAYRWDEGDQVADPAKLVCV